MCTKAQYKVVRRYGTLSWEYMIHTLMNPVTGDQVLLSVSGSQEHDTDASNTLKS
jgi:hypothetical protein